jgi:hypothetical protein
MDRLPYKELPEKLVAAVPELQRLYDHEVAGGLLSPYGFCGTQLVMLVRKLYNYARKYPDKGGQADTILQKILDFLEEYAQHPDDSIVDVIRNGFMEGMWLAGDDYDGIAALFSPESRDLLMIIEADYGKGAPESEIDHAIYSFIDYQLDFLAEARMHEDRLQRDLDRKAVKDRRQVRKQKKSPRRRR